MKMKTYKQFFLCMAMLMASMNLMAQREQLTFKGSIGNFPHGGSSAVTLTIEPEGKYEFSVEGSGTVTPFTIKGTCPPYLIYYQQTSNGKGVKSTGATWSMQISEWTAFGNTFKKSTTEYKPVQGQIKGSVVGMTNEKSINLTVTLRAELPNGEKFQYPLTCTLDK